MNGLRILTPPILFSSLLGLLFSWVTLLQNLKLKTYNLQLSTRVPYPWFEAVKKPICQAFWGLLG